MSKRRVVLLLLLGAGPLPAQSEPGGEKLARLEQRAESLAKAWRESEALANLLDSLARDDRPSRVDTLAVGSLRIISNASPLPLKAAAERVWPTLDSLYGSAAGQLEQRPYLIHAVDPDSNSRGGSWGMAVPWDWKVKELAALLRFNVPMPRVDRAFSVWSGDELRPSIHGVRRDLEQSYVSLVTSHYRAGQDCFVGSIESCRSVLWLDTPFAPSRIYRTPDEQREVLKDISVGYLESETRAGLAGCNSGNDSICVELLRVLGAADRLPRPVGNIARQTLVRAALTLGGREAYIRLMSDSTAPISTRLTRAAGVPLDSLLRVWHRSVIAARPRPVAVPSFGALAGLGWIAVFGLCALRSSRWRVG